MRVRITAVDGYTKDVPRDRFEWNPPAQEDYANGGVETAWVESNCSRVYTEVADLDELRALLALYGPLKLRIRDDDESDGGMVEIILMHQCY
jgi:hypothetical protein